MVFQSQNSRSTRTFSAAFLPTVVVALFMMLSLQTDAASAAEAGVRPSSASPVPQAGSRLNVLFIAVDDMNDFPAYLGGYDGTVHTPNLDRLSRQGVAFLNAHCASPLCCPSRTAVMSGRRPSSTGIYGNDQWWRPAHPDLKTIPMFFRENGYRAVGAGKIYHHTAGSNPPDQWDAYHPLIFEESAWLRDDKVNYPWTPPMAWPPGAPYSKIPEFRGEFDFGVLPIAEKDYDDFKTTSYAIEALKKPLEQPLFLAVGMFRPHIPLYASQNYFDLYPLDSIHLPETPADDLADVPEAGRAMARTSDKDRRIIEKHDAAKRVVQAYLASISFADAQVGRLIDALAANAPGNASMNAGNTIVVLCSDHGFHLGEKQHWAKRTLWERATRVPFLIVAPGVTRPDGRCVRPVNLLDIYPTLVALTGLTGPPGLDGHDLTPLLKEPNADWEWPSVIEYEKGNCAVVSERYRYIQYADKTEELYDHQSDRREFKNLASDPAQAGVLAELRKSVTKRWSDDVLPKKAYDFDPQTYSWTKRSKPLKEKKKVDSE